MNRENWIDLATILLAVLGVIAMIVLAMDFQTALKSAFGYAGIAVLMGLGLIILIKLDHY